MDSISKYITSLFIQNGFEGLYNFYERIKILSQSEYKGIYLHKCKKTDSIEKFISLVILIYLGLNPKFLWSSNNLIKSFDRKSPILFIIQIIF